MAIPGTTTALTSARMDEAYNRFWNMTDREVLESVRAHFEHHPALPGEKALRETAGTMLDDLNTRQHEDGSAYTMYDGWSKWADAGITRQSLCRDYSVTRIRETSVESNFNLQRLNVDHFVHSPVKELDIPGSDVESYVKQQSHFNNNVYVGRIEAMLTKAGDEVYVSGQDKDGSYYRIGSLPEKFLKNNPMLNDTCRAEIEFADFSFGESKNISLRVVVDTDLMAGTGHDLRQEKIVAAQPQEGAVRDPYYTMKSILNGPFAYDLNGTELTLTSYSDGSEVKLDFANMDDQAYGNMYTSDNSEEGLSRDDAIRTMIGVNDVTFDGSTMSVRNYYTGDEVGLNLDYMYREDFNTLYAGEVQDDEFAQAVGSISAEDGMKL